MKKNASSKKLNGNEEVLEAISNLALATGAGLEQLKKHMDSQFEDVRHDIHRLEAIILKDHEQRLEIMERKLGISR